MKKFIFAIGFILCSTVLSGCTSTPLSTGHGNNHKSIAGWGSSIDPAEGNGGRGGYSNSVFYY